MIKGKTSSGFGFSVKEEAFDDMRVVDALAKIADGTDPLKLSFLTEHILGREQREALYKHLEEDGRVPIEKAGKEIMEIFAEYGNAGKNS